MALRLPTARDVAGLIVASALAAGALSSLARSETIEQTQPEVAAKPDFTVTRIAGPFNFPWSVAFLPEGLILVTERWGDLKLIVPGEPEPLLISGTPERLTADHAGLMDVVLDPEFANNDTIYLSYVYGTREAATIRVLKARLDIENLSLEDSKLIFESFPPTAGTEQLGGRMAIDRAGLLYLTLGDRFDGRHAQNLSDDYGKITRMRRNGTFPDDNPFIGTPQARPGIWSYGHRNQQGLAFDPADGQLWAIEHGPMGGDELNRIEPGRNYGWPLITYGVDYDGSPINHGLTEAEGLEQPVRYWVPSIGPSGLTLYGGHVSDWQSTAWLGSLASQMLVRVKLENGRVILEEHFLKDELGRIRDVRMGPDGLIYFTTDSEEGSLYQIAPTEEYATKSKMSQGRLE
ncbi:MAG: PQQ-dependent sugar dehydrogenase [Rhizobiales bacterium]|nr:PQQ-dependent sugar dehydrogenase [Hyphomicrobiales bacterium]